MAKYTETYFTHFLYDDRSEASSEKRKNIQKLKAEQYWFNEQKNMWDLGTWAWNYRRMLKATADQSRVSQIYPEVWVRVWTIDAAPQEHETLEQI